MPEESVVIDEVWEEKSCPVCNGHKPIYEGMVCNECGGFGFKMQLVSQTQFINGEVTEVWPDE